MLYKNKKTVVAIGKFDGVHIGHRELLTTASGLAEKAGLVSLCYIVAPRESKVIFLPEKREEIVKSHGIDKCVVQDLTEDFMNMSPEDFVGCILKDRLDCVHVVVGYDFRFGKNRVADALCLERLCKKEGIDCTVIPEVKCETESGYITASSSNIKKALECGNVKEAATILGRPYFISGRVVHGKKIGRTLDFPTANIIADSNKILPKNGVYLTATQIDDISYPSITNIGKNPTVNQGNNITVETHIIGMDSVLYGKKISVLFKDRIRDEMKFSSVNDLKNQIKKDIEASLV